MSGWASGSRALVPSSKADTVFLQPFLRWILQNNREDPGACMHACVFPGQLQPHVHTVPSTWDSSLPRPTLPACHPPCARMSVVHLYGNDSCLSRSTWEASLATVTSTPFPKLSFSGVSTTHCSKICCDMNQAAPWLSLSRTPLCSDTDGSCSAPRVCFTQLFVCHLEAQDVEQVLERYFWPDAPAESIMRPSGEGLFCQLGGRMMCSWEAGVAIRIFE